MATQPTWGLGLRTGPGPTVPGARHSAATSFAAAIAARPLLPRARRAPGRRHDPAGPARHRTTPRTRPRPARWCRACILPSGLSPSVPEFHRVHRSLAATGSRTVTAGSEFHRPRSTLVLHSSGPHRCGTGRYLSRQSPPGNHLLRQHCRTPGAFRQPGTAHTRSDQPCARPAWGPLMSPSPALRGAQPPPARRPPWMATTERARRVSTGAGSGEPLRGRPTTAPEPNSGPDLVPNSDRVRLGRFLR